MSLCVLAMFKNESATLREWLQHYIEQGAAHFILLNNGSTDDWSSSVRGFPVQVLDKPKRHAQIEHYNSVLASVKRFAWCLVVDIDEYMYARKGTLSAFVQSLPPHVSQVLVHWAMFGSSGHVQQPPSVRKHFTWRRAQLSTNTKGLVRTSQVVSLNIHAHTVSGSTVVNDTDLALNHYVIMSWAHFAAVKMTRGASDSPAHEHIRDAAYFKRYDAHEVCDTELADRV